MWRDDIHRRELESPSTDAAAAPAGAGLALGVCGLAALLLSFFAMPWISEGGQDVTFSDLREAFHPDEQPVTAQVVSYDKKVKDLRVYTDWAWIMVLYLAAGSVALTTWIVPRNSGARTLLGLLVNPCLGLFHLADPDGSHAPRILGTITALYVLGVQGLNMWHLFWEDDGSPDPALGALFGLMGAVAVVAACIVGTERELVPAHASR